ncbi:MAG TPA: winged helix-turn-helix domain-containing protein [Rhizomicrobium sp.]|nr:winged helix-turn-helix domain-containing protein [Rhizomicrobium sp.]
MAAQRPFAIGAWTVDPARGTIGREGRETRLEPRLMELLLLFAGSPGRVLSKDEIVASVWQGRAIGDDTLAAAISRLRTALGATKDNRVIETLPKRGYRLLVMSDAAPAAAPRAAADRTEELLRKGRAALAVPLPQSLAQARIYFEAAIAADPGSAAAHAGLAEAMLTQHAAGQGASFAASAKAAAQAALALDDRSALAWALLGTATLVADRDFAAADAALLRAVALDPDLTRAHRARSLALAAVGRFVEAEREARRALALEPLTVSAHVDLVQLLLAARRFAPALVEAKKVIRLSAASAEAWSAFGWTHALLGDHRDAVDALLESLRLLGSDAGPVARLRAAFDARGFEAFCTAGADLFAQQRVMFVARPMDLAMMRANAGETDAAFAALEDAVRADDPVVMFLPFLPHLDRLRNDPRFAALAARARPVR